MTDKDQPVTVGEDTEDANTYIKPVYKKKTDIDPGGSNDTDNATFATLIELEDTHMEPVYNKD